MSTFLQKLARYKELSGMSREEIGQKLGVTGRYIGMIERGEKTVDESSAISLLLDLRISDASRNIVPESPAEYITGARALLKRLREKNRLSVSELATAVGYSVPVYREIEEGRSNMSRKMAERVAKELGCDVTELLDGSDQPPSNGTHFGTFGETPPVNVPPGMKVKYVPLLSMAQCGTMSAYDDSAYTHDGFIAFNSEDAKAFAVKLAGDSMTPVFSPGDVAVIYPSKPPKNGGVVIAKLNEDNGSDVMVKLYQASGNNVILSSYNPAFPAITHPKTAFAWIYPVKSVTKVLE